MKHTFLYLILLFSCSNRIVNLDGARVMVVHNHRVAQDGDTLYGEKGHFIFTFISEESEGVYPQFYMYGNIYVDIHPKINKIEPNTSYRITYKFKKPGKAVIMLVWEGKDHIGHPFTLNLQYL